ncbi:putative MFS-type transporter YcaD [Aquimixticola soesokkakensis]|uniref:Putative MFS-type transporter YcaD n=1 Tax=Aquimixticola soesokkakensis TaxID=1519096 RepID=A0A1Y5SNK1_9RHOB|nr:MFS transporter [Aquimixticola soesokkakensis]SLN44671.1 putative MFS-type transporter YcaD [Aquimixticola soesokkakensis]
MFNVLKSSYALLLGMMLLMIGNGLQGTLLGVRGPLEGFSTTSMSFIMSAYFAGFMGGSRAAPLMIRRVGHVRVFAAVASFISAALIIFPAVTDPYAWFGLRVVLGFCFASVYVTAESWLNNSATNETRGKALSLYMMVQMAGIVIAQWIVTRGDPSGFILFIVPSVLVSISFAPILLTVSPAPPHAATKDLPIRELFRISPLGCAGMLLTGGVFAAQYGMSAVYATLAGLTVDQLSLFIALIYVGAVVLQYPIGWISDRIDRRILIAVIALIGALAAIFGAVMPTTPLSVYVAAFLIGGMTNPLYSLLIAHTGDFMQPEDMASTSGGLLFLNGVGAVAGPLVAGLMLEQIGPSGYWVLQGALLAVVAGYALWRTTRRAAPASEDTASYVSILPTASPMAVEFAQEWAAETALAEQAEQAEEAAQDARGDAGDAA